VRHEQLAKIESYEIVDPQAAIARAEAAVPDVPGAIGVMMVAVYVLIVGLFALTIATAGTAPFMIAVDAAFLAAFFAVPVIFLKLERDPARRPTMSRFMAEGMQTYTGHVTGGGALAQMFVVPVLLAFAVLAMGVTVMLS
jgi:hypothetical protein